MLECKNLSKVYGGRKSQVATTAVKDVSIKIDRGEFVAIMGPSGSGKSTLLNMFGCMDKPTTGEIVIDKKRISDLREDELAIFKRRNIGFVFQDFNLLDSLNLKENVMLPLVLDGVKAQAMEERASKIMKVFDIEDIAQKYPYNISGGQQQRVAVARAVVNEPLIVFADEPTGNLDSKSSNSVMKCFTKMNVEMQTTILMVTHDAFAASYANRIIFIKDGNTAMEIVKSQGRRQFFDKILDCMAVLGGESNEF